MGHIGNGITLSLMGFSLHLLFHTSSLIPVVFLCAGSKIVQVDETGTKVRPKHNRSVLMLREIPDTTQKAVSTFCNRNGGELWIVAMGDMEEGEHHLPCISSFALGGSVLLSVTSHCIIASLACLVFFDGSIPTSDLSMSSCCIISSLAGFLDGSVLMSDCHVSDQSLHQYFTGMSGVLRGVNTNVRSVSNLLLHHIFSGMVLRWISTDISLSIEILIHWHVKDSKMNLC